MRPAIISQLLFVLACATQPPDELCDWNEVSGILGGFESRIVDGEEVSVPTPWPPEPVMIPCDCEMDPWLRELEFADPEVDAKQALRRERPSIYGEVGFTHSFPGARFSDYDFLDLVDWKPYPWDEDPLDCYEEERLTKPAREYFWRYNRLVMDGVRSR